MMSYPERVLVTKIGFDGHDRGSRVVAAYLRDAGMECTHIGDGEVEGVLTVPESLSNTYGTMHGGAVSTVIDVLGTMALLTKDHTRAVRPTHPVNYERRAPLRGAVAAGGERGYEHDLLLRRAHRRGAPVRPLPPPLPQLGG